MDVGVYLFIYVFFISSLLKFFNGDLSLMSSTHS